MVKRGEGKASVGKLQIDEEEISYIGRWSQMGNRRVQIAEESGM